MVRLALQGKTDGVVGRGIAGMQGGDDIHAGGQGGGMQGFFHCTGQKMHPGETEPARQFFRFFNQLGAVFDTDDGACRAALEEQVVQNKAEIGFAGAMIDQGFQIVEQRLDELRQMVDLLQLAPAVLIELAVTGQDVQFLEQFQGLARADFRGEGDGFFRHGTIIAWCLARRDCRHSLNQRLGDIKWAV